jgi:hypothetical protein
MSGSSGGKGNFFGQGPPPGTVDPFSLGVLQEQTALSEQAMNNRYNQLGLGTTTGNPIAAAASGTSLTKSGPSTAQRMDVGTLPSATGGIPGMSAATLGQMELNALSSPSGSGAGFGSGKGIF